MVTIFKNAKVLDLTKEKGYYNLSVLGTKEFLDEYENILMKELKKEKRNKRTQNGQALGIQYGGRMQLLKIYNFLYKDATIYLERKIQKFAVLR